MKPGWQTKTLGEVCEIYRGGSPRPIKDFITSDPSGVNWIKIGDVSPDGKFIDKSAEKIINSGIKHSRFVERGDFLLSNSMSFGRPYICRIDGCIHDGWLVLKKVSGSFVPDFLYYLLRSPSVSSQFDLLAKGSTVRNLNRNSVAKVIVPVPSFDEQKRIVGILDDAFEKIDAVKRNAEQNLANAKELFQSTLDEMMTPKEGWRKAALKEIGMTITGQTPPTKDSMNFGKDIPFIKPADITQFATINYQNEGLSFQGVAKSRLIRKDSVLMVCIGASIGKVGYATQDVTCNQQINAVIPKNMYCGKFVYYALSSSTFQMLVLKNDAQATLPIISKSKWEALPIDFPEEIKKQKSIVCKLDNLLERCNLYLHNYKNVLSKCAELKQQILTKAFRGEL